MPRARESIRQPYVDFVPETDSEGEIDSDGAQEEARFVAESVCEENATPVDRGAASGTESDGSDEVQVVCTNSLRDLVENAPQRVYLVTYSRADESRFPTWQAFSDVVVNVFGPENVCFLRVPRKSTAKKACTTIWP